MRNKELKDGDKLYFVSYENSLDPEDWVTSVSILKVRIKDNLITANIANWNKYHFVYSPYIFGHKNGHEMTGDWNIYFNDYDAAIRQAEYRIRADLYENILNGIKQLEKAGFNTTLTLKEE